MEQIIYPIEYLNIITSACKRGLTKKSAKELGINGQLHHIIPRSVAPELAKEKFNIVFLTHEEHYIVHKLLAEANPNNRIALAWQLMYCKKTTKEFFSAEDYAKAIAISNEFKSSDANPLKGKKRDKKVGEKISASKRGKPNGCKGRPRPKNSGRRKGMPRAYNSGAPRKCIVHINTGTIIKSIADAERFGISNGLVGINKANISTCVNGRRKSCGKDIYGNAQYWRFATQEEIKTLKEAI